ncbi:MAG: hypothetical protein RIS34_2387 [Pseudomonadota bacterium]|jgi:UDP-2,3-diacylglucosamine hydrolase
MTTTDSRPVLHAPAHWAVVDFISDLHLQSSEPATFDAWQHYMGSTPADAVFILGDLFEVWVGDDVLTAKPLAHPDTALQASHFEARCAEVIHAASQRLAVFVMHGNRDFLMGPALMTRCGAQLLADPTTFEFGGQPGRSQRWLLTHGDSLCLADTAYMQFRAQVRSEAWQTAFLAKPLVERQAIARDLREQSESRKRASTAADYADVDATAARSWLGATHANTLIHGHTHQPADHDLGAGLRRVVLSDWDAHAMPPRMEVLRLSRDATNAPGGLQVQPRRLTPG